MIRLPTRPVKPTVRALAVVVFSASLVGADAAAAGALDLFYERTLMTAAGARCGLFQPPVEAALAAASAQARSAALRAGEAEADISNTRGRALGRAQSVSCDAPDLTLAAGRVRTAFQGWAKVSKVIYPGAGGGWTADRSIYSSPTWRLVAVSGSQVSFGLARADGAAALTATVSGGEAPYGARLRFRDTGRDNHAWLPRPGAALPPADSLRTVFANDTGAASPVLAHGGADAVAFRFPDWSADAIAALDPRESVAVEFLYRGDRVRTAVFEVGDFAAGRAFISVGRR
jgi:hypothetical protein